MIHTGRCKHCGKTKEEHPKDGLFTDSGLSALDAHKEELYLAIIGYFSGFDNCDIDKERVYEMELRSILNQIEKEK